MTFRADTHIGRSVMRRVEVLEIDDTGPIQKLTVKGLEGEVFKVAMRGQPHGLTGVPTKGSIGYVYMANGRPDQSFFMAIEDPNLRPKNRQPGETIVYGKQGQKLEQDANGNTIVRSPNGTIHLNPP
jgi:phage baseplate assembly protein V